MAIPKFATQAQLGTLCTWITEGPGALDQPAFHASPRREGRNYSLRLLSGLTERLDLGPHYQAMRLSAPNGSPLSEMLNPSLREELYRRSRMSGYILRDGSGLVPLTALRIEILQRLSWGLTMAETGQALGVTPQGVSVSLATARREHGCATVAQLIACAYRNEWFPVHDEIRDLSSPSVMSDWRVWLRTRGHSELVA